MAALDAGLGGGGVEVAEEEEEALEPALPLDDGSVCFAFVFAGFVGFNFGTGGRYCACASSIRFSSLL